MTDMGKLKVIINGFEFEVGALYAGDTDIERLNTYLEEKFNKCGIKTYMSNRHPELFPDHIGLQADANLRLKLVRYTRSGLDDCGEYTQGYEVGSVNNLGKYKADLLEYFRDREPDFYRFIIAGIN